MLRAIFLQASADLRHRWVQTALVFFVIAAAATVLMLALTVWRASSEPYEQALDEANGPHAWFFGSQSDLLRIAERDGVVGFAGPYTVSYNFSVTVGTERHSVCFWDTGAELPEVEPALLTEGRWLAPDGQDEVIIGAGFAREAGFEVGDEIVVADETRRTVLHIVGIAANLERAPYPEWGPAVFHVLPSTMERLIHGRVNAWMLGVRLEDADTSEQFISQVHDDYPSVITRSWQEVRDAVSESNMGNVALLGVFSAFALLAVGFIIANTIGGQVLAQYREIGLLKAVGFTPGQVTGLLLLENMLIAVPAALVGAALGFALSPLFLSSLASLFSASAFPAFDPLVLGIGVAGVALITLVFTAVPAWRAGRLSTLRALTTGVMAEGSRPSLPAKIASRLRLPPLMVIAIKDAFSRPLRALLTIGALTLAVMTVTLALVIDATLVAAQDDPSLMGQQPFELQVVPRTMSNDSTEALINAHPEVERYVKRAWFEVDIPERYQHLGTWGLAGDYQEIGYPIYDGRMLSGPGEAVLGLGLARELDLGVGDTITFFLWGETRLELPVVGTYVEDADRGRRIMFDLATVEEIVPDPAFISFGVKLVPGTDAEAARQSLQQDGGEGIDVDNLAQDWVDTLQESRREIRTILFSLNGMLLAVAVVSLLTSLLFTVRERQRDVGILKSIGLTPVQVVGAFVMGSTVFALLAAVIGLPAGVLLTNVLIDFAAQKDGLPKGIAETPSAGWLLLVIPLAIAVTVIGSALPAIQAGRSRITDAMRYE
jgi:putative ABC transport system permease protein